MNGYPGANIGLLDTLLITGFNINNVTTANRSGNEVIVNVSSGHGFATNDIIELSGCNQSQYNDEWKITVINSSSFSFPVPENYPLGSLTGSMVVRYPPVSSYWSKVASDNYQAVYQSTHPDGTNHYLAVDDSGYRYSSVTMTETFTSANSGFSNTNTHYWQRSDADTDTGRYWSFIGDAKRFYFCPAWSAYSTYQTNKVAELYFFR